MTWETGFLDTLDLAADQVDRTAGQREQYATDFGTSLEEGTVPDVVVYPESTADVSAILAVANDQAVPVTPYAAGTSMEGHPIPVHGGISMDLTRMDRILDIRPGDLQVDVQPGVIGEAIDTAVEPNGLFLPPLPSSADISTIGGMIANDASGMKTVKYGEIREWVRELEVVLADGSVIEPGTRARKSSSGYNLKELFVGSEGTLGVITRATMELAGRPEYVWGGRAAFESTENAAAAVADAIKSGVDVATIELMDPLSMRIANEYLDTGLDDTPTVFFEFHGNQPLEDEVAFCRTVFEAHDAMTFDVSDDRSGYEDLWESRRQIGHAVMSYDPDLVMLTVGDVSVPMSAYAEIIEYAHEQAETYDLLIPCFGHGGDGNVHYTILVDPNDQEHVGRARVASDRIVSRAIALGGTVTGEHGIGRSKRRHLPEEHGARQVDLMRQLKSTFDPAGILNPGKVLPDGQ